MRLCRSASCDQAPPHDDKKAFIWRLFTKFVRLFTNFNDFKNFHIQYLSKLLAIWNVHLTQAIFFFIVRLTTILYCMWIAIIVITSCARGDTICLPLQVDNIFAFIRQVAPVPACWLFKTSATSWPSTFWPWKWCPSHVWRGLPVCQF